MSKTTKTQKTAKIGEKVMVIEKSSIGEIKVHHPRKLRKVGRRLVVIINGFYAIVTKSHHAEWSKGYYKVRNYMPIPV